MSSSGFSFSAALSAAQSTKDDNKSADKVKATPSFSMSGALAATAKVSAEVTAAADNKKSTNSNASLLKADEWQRGEVQLRCVEKWNETHDVVSFRFQGLSPVKFNYKPGQFITFKLEIEGEMVYRSYTMSSSPSRPYSIVVTVKRIPGGKVSNFLADNVNQDDIVTLMGPDGVFNLVDIEAGKYLFLSAGSGITPMYSMSRWLLDTKVGSDIAFVHSARGHDDIIFADSLAAMAHRSAQFELSYLLESADELVEGINHTANDSRMLGRLDIEKLQHLVPDFMSRTIFVCGPEPYMVAVKSMIEASSFEMKNFHQESFTGAVKSDAVLSKANADTANNSAVFMLTIDDKAIKLAADKTLLDGIESEGLPIIAACRSGVCGACKCQVTSGTTESSSTMTLTAEEIAAGYVLACSTKVTSDVTLKM